MSGKREKREEAADLVVVEPAGEVTVVPPDGGVIGKFLHETRNTFKARAMRMAGQFRRINEAGQRMESMLRDAADAMEAAESRLEQDLFKEGLLSEEDAETEEE